MNKIYTKENVKKTIVTLQKRYSNFYNRDFTVEEIIYAFNKLPGKYQDLLLKINKDENDKILLNYAYNNMKKQLLNNKEKADETKVNLKNINAEVKKKREEFEKEDTEASNGDKWVRLEPKKTVIDKTETKKQEKIVIETKIKKEEPVVEEIVKKEPVIEETKEDLNKRLVEVILEEYIEDRKKIDMDELIDAVDLGDNEKYILRIKYGNNSVKDNEEVSKIVCLTTSYIDEVVDRFLDLSIKYKTSKTYKLERK